MLESESHFKKMVDDLVEFSDYDNELKDGIQWLDKLAQKKGISFYDAVFDVLYRNKTKNDAKIWLNERD